jgi:hypothetical protein
MMRADPFVRGKHAANPFVRTDKRVTCFQLFDALQSMQKTSDACNALAGETRVSDEEWFARNGAAIPAEALKAEKFAALVEPLELVAGRRLSGFNRARCYRAFIALPEVFEALVEDTARRATRNPVGLLCRRVIDGDHLTYLDGKRLNATPPTDEGKPQ